MYTVQYVGRKKGLWRPFGSFFLLLSVLFCCFSPHYVTSSKLLQYLRWKVYAEYCIEWKWKPVSVHCVQCCGAVRFWFRLDLHFHPYYCVLRCYTVEEEKVETYEIFCVFFKKLAHDQNIARGSRLCNTVSSPFPFWKSSWEGGGKGVGIKEPNIILAKFRNSGYNSGQCYYRLPQLSLFSNLERRTSYLVGSLIYS